MIRIVGNQLWRSHMVGSNPNWSVRLIFLVEKKPLWRLYDLELYWHFFFDKGYSGGNSPDSVSFGVFSHSKGLGANWHASFVGFFGANGFCLRKGSVEGPSTVLYICLRVPYSTWCCVNCRRLSPLHLHSAKKPVVAVGVLFGVICYFSLQGCA